MLMPNLISKIWVSHRVARCSKNQMMDLELKAEAVVMVLALVAAELTPMVVRRVAQVALDASKCLGPRSGGSMA